MCIVDFGNLIIYEYLFGIDLWMTFCHSGESRNPGFQAEFDYWIPDCAGMISETGLSRTDINYNIIYTQFKYMYLSKNA